MVSTTPGSELLKHWKNTTHQRSCHLLSITESATVHLTWMKTDV